MKVDGRPRLEAYYDLYRRLSAEGVAKLIDPAGWEARIDAVMIPDGVHPSPAAHRQVTLPAPTQLPAVFAAISGKFSSAARSSAARSHAAAASW